MLQFKGFRPKSHRQESDLKIKTTKLLVVLIVGFVQQPCLVYMVILLPPLLSLGRASYF